MSELKPKYRIEITGLPNVGAWASDAFNAALIAMKMATHHNRAATVIGGNGTKLDVEPGLEEEQLLRIANEIARAMGAEEEED